MKMKSHCFQIPPCHPAWSPGLYHLNLSGLRKYYTTSRKQEGFHSLLEQAGLMMENVYLCLAEPFNGFSSLCNYRSLANNDFIYVLWKNNIEFQVDHTVLTMTRPCFLIEYK